MQYLGQLRFTSVDADYFRFTRQDFSVAKTEIAHSACDSNNETKFTVQKC